MNKKQRAKNKGGFPRSLTPAYRKGFVWKRRAAERLAYSLLRTGCYVLVATYWLLHANCYLFENVV